MTSRTSWIISGSSAEVGSSKSMSWGPSPARARSRRAAAGRRRGRRARPRPSPGCRRSRELVRAGARGGRLDPLHLPRREHDVLEDGHMRKQVELLKDHADVGAHPPDRLRSRIDACPRTGPAGVDRLEAVDAAQHRRLARARWARDDDRLAGADREVDLVEHDVVAEALADIAQLDERRGGLAVRSRMRPYKFRRADVQRGAAPGSAPARHLPIRAHGRDSARGRAAGAAVLRVRGDAHGIRRRPRATPTSRRRATVTRSTGGRSRR